MGGATDVEIIVAAAREFGMHAILFQNTAQVITNIDALLHTGRVII